MTHRIPQHFIQDLLHQVNLVDLIEKRIRLKKAGARFIAKCPFHQEKTASFSVDPNKQFYYCFGCQAHGNAIGFLMAYDRLEFLDAVENLAASIGLPLPSENNPPPPSYEDLYGLMEKATAVYHKCLLNSPKALTYLEHRGISKPMIKQFCLGFAPNTWDYLTKKIIQQPQLLSKMKDIGMLCEKQHEPNHYYDRFRNRLLFPIQNKRGRTVGFGGRSIDHQLPKYLNSPETPLFHKGSELYGLNFITKANHILVVEGYLDVIALHQHGFAFAVAPLGTAITRKQIQILLRYTSNITFCFDADTAGKKAAWRALETLLPLMKDGIHACFLTLPLNEDPDSYLHKKGAKAFGATLLSALPLSDFFFNTLSQPYNLNTIHGRTQFASIVKEHLDNMPNGLFKQLMLDKLANMIQISSEHLEASSIQTPKLDLPILPLSKKILSARNAGIKNKSPSLMRAILVLLLQQPSLIEHLSDIEVLNNLQMPGISLLQQLIQILKQHPNLSTGALLEFFREKPKEQKQLAKLASTSLFISLDEAKTEFIEAIKRLKKKGIQETINQLQFKLHQLTHEEKEMLQRLIAYKVLAE